ncbi:MULTISPECIES: adenosylcobalamin-dependent ribonucleoside-diphosphate reductase [unclassified Guyparkeria]|uniref:adenosylcobalamin-dependent ribonucleoside-diphosphate reductase n=1 Tax=unclassified Guyparkeria TaxID=2626246 RepID=UPI000733400B|nr:MULTISPECIES: adenosylcobalamin-dependent ribonucleoside-diphosphate reductase [unclassified Guyparkeria]KTG17529.1 ribonucleoside-diphosphate reductase [Guyparkeria sp. XI15]OAE88344.1 ribonucleoside-diphosphate reductase [Guyparkeria sp. WRN-7]
MAAPFLDTPISRHIWATRYRYGAEPDIEASWHRVAAAIAKVEAEPAVWARRFRDLLADFRFLPGGRILAGAGTDRQVTLFNCFVMGRIEDSMDGIFEALKEGALTMQQGGGVGYDFSTLRPAGTAARHAGTIASGPVSFMRIWDSMCATILSTGARRGAMMATLRVDHPDIEAFIDAKHQAGELTHFNCSVLVTDAFMAAVHADADWSLVFPSAALGEAREEGEGELVRRAWPGFDEPVACRVIRRVRARDLWERIMRATYSHAEPGVLFIDRINQWNNLGDREHISATNPCGEIPLPPYGACDLGSINLTRFVVEPFRDGARLDHEGLGQTAALAVRFLDNVIDASHFPLPAQTEQARDSRRLGLGVTGLADALIMLGLHYDSEVAREQAGQAMATITQAAYRASIALAREKRPFPLFDKAQFLDRPFVHALPGDIRAGIARDGIRNSHLTAIAPTGTISLLAGNVSSGVEPVFRRELCRPVLTTEGQRESFRMQDAAWRRWQADHGEESLPPAFVEAEELPPEAHLAMQAALQPHVDSAISKTINVPESMPFASFEAIYQRAFELGLKGCTTYRPNPVTGAVLQGVDTATPCCGIDRESD